jgi:hypothetical protein
MCRVVLCWVLSLHCQALTCDILWLWQGSKISYRYFQKMYLQPAKHFGNFYVPVKEYYIPHFGSSEGVKLFSGSSFLCTG